MKLYFWTCTVAFLASLPLCSQIKIGNNPERISQASVLELESNHRVLVITRVTTQEMEQITPLKGAMAFNTDTGCIHYFDGASWKNLCATPTTQLTAMPVVHENPTLVVTSRGNQLHLEVLAIDEKQIEANSIGGNLLKAGAVTKRAIDFNSVTLNDFHNDAGFIDENTLVSPEPGNVITNRAGVFYDDSGLRHEMAEITELLKADGDNDDMNELQALALNGNVLAISDGNFVDLSPFAESGGDDQNLSGELLEGNVLQINIDDGLPARVDLSGLADRSVLQTAAEVPFNPTGNTRSAEVQSAIEELQLELDGISAGGTANPSDELQELILNNTALSLLPSAPGASPVDLDPLLVTEAELAVLNVDDADADPTNEIQGLTSSDGSVLITPEGINFDLSVAGGGTDDQNLTSATLAGTQLTIAIENGNPVTADLGSLATDTELAALNVDDADADPTNEIQGLTSSDGSVHITPAGINFDLSVTGGGTDDQNLTSATLAGTQLTIAIENGNPVTADLGSLATDTELAALNVDDADADPTNEIQGLTSSDGSVHITPAGINFDLSVTGGGTDDQNLTSATLAGTQLTIAIENGNPVTADLGSLATDTELAALNVDDADANPTNEIQGLTSSDGSVLITPAGINFDLTVAGGGTDDQNLTSATLAGSQLTIAIENGNPVTADLGSMATDTELAALNVDDADADPTNEIQNISSPDASINVNRVGNNFEIQMAGSATSLNLANSDLTQTGGDRIYELDGQNLSFDGSGSIGIGTDNPQSKLHVSGEVRSSGYANSNGVAGEPSYAFNNDPDTGMWRGGNVNHLRFSTAGIEALTISPEQNVGIGTNTPTERLHVAGNILASGTITPDYVFEAYYRGISTSNPVYRMWTLQEIEAYIRHNHHLPGVPSAQETAHAGGVVVNRATEINLEKIEELFLHTIRQEQELLELYKIVSGLSDSLHVLSGKIREFNSVTILE